jgi:hypothetical protein
MSVWCGPSDDVDLFPLTEILHIFFPLVSLCAEPFGTAWLLFLGCGSLHSVLSRLAFWVPSRLVTCLLCLFHMLLYLFIVPFTFP